MKFSAIFFIILTIGFSQLTNTVVSVTGVTQNELTQENIKAKITVKDEAGKVINRTNSMGDYFITGLTPGNNYKLEISAKGYFMKSYDLTVPNTDKYEEISRDFTLKPMAVGVKIPLKVIPFDIGKSEMRAGIDYLFKDLVQILRRNKKAEIAIQVYPESSSDQLEKTKLRAENILNYLKSKKVRASLVSEPKSELDPDNPPPAGKQAKGKRYKGSIYFKVLKA
jgi:outer membrane protein OmpA-like peptidoglycan-associated protein